MGLVAQLRGTESYLIKAIGEVIDDNAARIDNLIMSLETVNRREGPFYDRSLSLAITHLEDARYRLRDYQTELKAVAT